MRARLLTASTAVGDALLESMIQTEPGGHAGVQVCVVHGCPDSDTEVLG